MRIRTKMYRYLVSYDCVDKLNKKQSGNNKMFLSKKINLNNIKQIEKMIKDDYGDNSVCINNIVLL